MNTPRLQRPIVVVAYGLRGASWLDSLRSELLPPPSDHTGDGQALPLQFWAIGLDPGEFSGDLPGLKCMGEDPDADHLRNTLDEIRTTTLTREFPGLEVGSVLVLERWSPLDDNVDVRTALHQRCDLGTRDQFREGAGREIHLDWIGLADAVRPAGGLPEEVGRRIREHFTRPYLSLFHFLVDRQNEQSAVIGLVEADEMLRVVARSIILAEWSGGSPLRRLVESDTDDSDNCGTVIGFSVGRFRHGYSELNRAAENRFRHQLMASPLDPASLSASGSLRESIRQDLEQDVAFPIGSGDEERFESVSQALAGALARKKVGTPHPWKQIEEASQEVRADRVRAVRHGGSPDEGTILGPRFLSAFGRLWLWIKSLFRPHAEPPGPQEVTSWPASDTSEGSPEHAWMELLNRARTVGKAWERWLIESPPVEVKDTCWTQEDGDLVLRAWPSAAEGLDQVPHSYWLELARRLLQEAETADEAAGTLVDNAIPHVVHRLESGVSKGGRSTVIEAALREAASTLAARNPPMSTFVGRSLKPSTVLWFHGLPTERGDLFKDFEDPSQSGPPQVFALNRTEDTVRISLTAPLPWTHVISLNVGRAE